MKISKNKINFLDQRSSGILLPINALPGKYGIGSLGSDAKLFIDFLQNSAQKYWQICPFGHFGNENSPYSCYSAFAGAPYFIDLDALKQEGLLLEAELRKKTRQRKNFINYEQIKPFYLQKLELAYERFCSGKFPLLKKKLENFLKKEISWIKDYALFMALKDYFSNDNWYEWPKAIKFRTSKALRYYEQLLAHKIQFYSFIQFLFYKQWEELVRYAHEHQVFIIGDVPIYISYKSAEVWARPKEFLLKKDLRPAFVAGVPPDYFSKTGQLWGNPLYDWSYMEKNKFQWWLEVFKHLTSAFDVVRIDHFRGFAAYWRVSAQAKTAAQGKWIFAPGEKLFKKIKQKLQGLPFIAEDLGLITPDVIALRKKLNLPGMTVLHFSLDTLDTCLPPSVIYTGTHDNNTTLGWFKQMNSIEQKKICSILGCSPQKVVSYMIETAFASSAFLAIVPMQDILQLDSWARTNTPGSIHNLFRFKLERSQLKKNLALDLRKTTQLYGRYLKEENRV
ncbi:MAG: 4-alpha-glucanotransferase [Oligoflexia bacterium]|nr:4-alpha-glucanotransferase [Oligoflexia bacterium]